MPELSRRALLRGAGFAALVAGLPPVAGRTSAESRAVLRSQPFRSGELGYSCYRTPGLAITAAGTVLAFCGGRLDNCRDEGNIDVLLRRSLDGGRSWGPLQVIADDGSNPCKIPVPVVLASGRILLLWMWNAAVQREADRGLRHLRLTVSDDDGRSWAPSRDITEQVRLAGWKPWSGIGPGHGIVKRLAPNAGRIVVPARHSVANRGSRSHLLLSDDGGLSWRVGAIASAGPSNECTVAELGDGSLMLNSRSRGGQRLVSISRDGGETMASSALDPQLIEPRNGCQASLLTYSFGPQRQATLLFANPVDRQHRTNGRIRVSRDNGRHWSRGFGTDPSLGAFSGYSDLARFSDGSVALLLESGAAFEKSRGEERRRNRRALAGRSDRRHDGITFLRVPFALIAAA
jgi:sialidase-1